MAMPETGSDEYELVISVAPGSTAGDGQQAAGLAAATPTPGQAASGPLVIKIPDGPETQRMLRDLTAALAAARAENASLRDRIGGQRPVRLSAPAAPGTPSAESLNLLQMQRERDAARADRDDYAARLKATDDSWAKLAMERDRLAAENASLREQLADVRADRGALMALAGQIIEEVTVWSRDPLDTDELIARWRRTAGLDRAAPGDG